MLMCWCHKVVDKDDYVVVHWSAIVVMNGADVVSETHIVLQTIK